MTCGKCDRPSVLPDDYAPLCSKHYMESVTKAQADAKKRMEEHLSTLREKKRNV